MSNSLTILGFNSAIPTIKSATTAQLLELEGHHFLIDCGEGTQVQLRKAKAKTSKINNIFISHLHGDHCFGLVGLISTYRLVERKHPLNVYGPKGIREMLETTFRISKVQIDFEIYYFELDSKESEVILENDQLIVSTIPLDHRIYCNGYLFRTKPKPRKLNIEEIKKYPEIRIENYTSIKNGEDFRLQNGKIISNHLITKEPLEPFSYAFCSDTRYKEDIIPIIKDVDLLYHESTFLHNLKEMADYTGHSTALEAAQIAKSADVGRLILGHFSNRYDDLEVFTNEARTVFAESYLPIALEPFLLQSKKLNAL